MASTRDALDVYVDAMSRAGAGSETEARQQVFKPTCYPDSLEIVPGVVLNKPLSFDYAPDIDAAQSKVRSLKCAAAAGKLAVLNFTMEPGAGKTLHLPFRFTESKSLVVMPALFDAWSAHLAATQPSDIATYNYSSGRGHSVTYTDSYYAAYLLTSRKISSYDIVFVDESHSYEGVTTFMASACIPGVTFVRMTATPESIRTAPRRSFPIMDERSAPELSDVNAVATFVSSRDEERKIIMAPSIESASLISSAIPSSVLLTPASSMSIIKHVLTTQVGPITIVTDSTCGRSINLNLDFVLDFGFVSTPTGTRKITVPEQQQRRARVGRNRPGVYCCPYVATSDTYVDQYSLFRNNLWFTVNSLQTNPCEFSDVSVGRAKALLKVFVEPATIPMDVHTVKRASSDSSYDSARSTTPSSDPDVHEVEVQDDRDPGLPALWQDGDVPSWLVYYLGARNHAAKYVGDLVHDHRSLDVSSEFVAGDVYVAVADNRRSIERKPKTQLSDVASEVRSYSGTTDIPVAVRRYSTADSSKSRPRSDKLERKYAAARDKGLVEGGPMLLNRANKTRGNHVGTAYKALSVSGDYLVEAGLVLASSSKIDSNLSPLSQRAMRAVNSGEIGKDWFRASHYLTWTVVKPLSEVDAPLERANASALGAWSPPPVNEIPKIDLHTEYHPSWVTVLTSRVRDRLSLPVLIPAVGWARRTARARDQSSPLDAALDVCEDPTFTVTEQQLVYRAWNVLAMRSASITPCDSSVYTDASILLTYMASADRLSDVQ